MTEYLDPKNNRLVFESEKADARFWDKLWSDFDAEKIRKRGEQEWFVSRFTKKFIRPGKSRKILEGGCGQGVYVYSLEKTGYDAYGIDNAPEIIRKLNCFFPELKIKFGDVENLDFPGAYFDGYWSLGVIEHFYDGYDKIALEMFRVLKPGGFLFLTFPHFSLLRKIKARLRKYPGFREADFDWKNFYQFALDWKTVRNDLEKIGFHLISRHGLDALKGLKDEIFPGNKTLQKIYRGQSVFFRIIAFTASKIFAFFCGHSILLIFQKNHD